MGVGSESSGENEGKAEVNCNIVEVFADQIMIFLMSCMLFFATV